MAYDAVKAHEYYEKYRKKGLRKGRKKKSTIKSLSKRKKSAIKDIGGNVGAIPDKSKSKTKKKTSKSKTSTKRGYFETDTKGKATRKFATQEQLDDFRKRLQMLNEEDKTKIKEQLNTLVNQIKKLQKLQKR